MAIVDVVQIDRRAVPIFSIPPGLECRSTCRASFPSGWIIRLRAVTPKTLRVTAWHGVDCSEPQPSQTCTFIAKGKSVITPILERLE
jgi:hypothetical protein